MKKVLMVIVVVCMLLGIMSCDVKTGDAVKEKTESAGWWENIDVNGKLPLDSWQSLVVESGTSFYYVAEDGVYYVDKSGGEAKCLIKDSVTGLVLCGNELYYSTEKNINHIETTTKECSEIWNVEMASELADIDFVHVSDFYIYGGALYIKYMGNRAFCYDLDEKTTKVFPLEFSSLAFSDGKCYHVDHAQRTFSVYETALASMETTMIQGDGKGYDDPEKLLYDEVQAANGRIYYRLREKNQIFEYFNGNTTLVFEFSEESGWMDIVHSINHDELCFYTKAGNQYTLYEYDGNGEPVEILSLDIGEKTTPEAIVTDSAIILCYKDSGETEFISRQ